LSLQRQRDASFLFGEPAKESLTLFVILLRRLVAQRGGQHCAGRCGKGRRRVGPALPTRNRAAPLWGLRDQ